LLANSALPFLLHHDIVRRKAEVEYAQGDLLTVVLDVDNLLRDRVPPATRIFGRDGSLTMKI
jgi:hypothetical protein